MIKKTLLLSFVFFVNHLFLNAQTIDNIVEKTFNNNYSLKALEESIKSTKEEITLSSKWKNPTLTFGVTDIQFDDIRSRDIEAMQSQFIGLSQVIPIGNKLEIQKEIAISDYEISRFLVEERKLQYKSKIYDYIYKIKLLEERLGLFKEFKANTKIREKLLLGLYKYNKA